MSNSLGKEQSEKINQHKSKHYIFFTFKVKKKSWNLSNLTSYETVHRECHMPSGKEDDFKTQIRKIFCLSLKLTVSSPAGLRLTAWE